jgi:hypothetical protein
MAVVVLLLTSVSQWTVPPDWGTPNSIDCIASGARGFYTTGSGGTGGGGGAFARKNNVSLTPGNVIPLAIGGFTSPALDTWFQSPSFVKAAGASGITGGQASSCVGDVTYSGGNGVFQNTSSGGGGGAAGPNGPGGNGFGMTGGSGGPGGGAPPVPPPQGNIPGHEYTITAGTYAGTTAGSGGGGSGGDQSSPWQVHRGGPYGGGGGGGNGGPTGGTPGQGAIIITYTQGGGVGPPPTAHRRTEGAICG